MREVYAWDFNPKQAITPGAKSLIKNLKKIDKLILKIAPAWPLKKINRIDLAILRLAVYELLIVDKNTPPKVIVDEAVEIGKEYGSASSPSFINGVLGKLIEEKKIQV